MTSRTLSKTSSRRYYDRIGAYYDWFTAFEAQAKQRALERLDLQPGMSLVNIGVGTGREHLRILSALAPGDLAVGLDLSPGMLAVARRQIADQACGEASCAAPLCQADGERLPFAPGSFERLCCLYTLDLVAQAELPGWLAGFRRVLVPGGRMVLLSLTEGVDRLSRAFVGLWKLGYTASPAVCGGCRPLQLAPLARQAGFEDVRSEVVVQMGIPSEILTARAPEEYA